MPLSSAEDYKRVGDGDTGPNTGGMGAFSPSRLIDPALEARVLEQIIRPTLTALADRGTPYRGVLYAGLMLTAEGPKLIEYNVRFGDPECQVLMMRLKDDIVTLMLGAVDGVLDTMSARFRDVMALTVVIAARAYPGKVETGAAIQGLDAAAALEDVVVFQAGTRRARRPAGRQRRPCPQCDSLRRDPRDGAAPRLSGGGADHAPRRLLPSRHWQTLAIN